MEIKKPYNPYQEQAYRLAYSTDTRKRAKATHYVVKYLNETLTNPTSYALSQISLKEFRMMSRFTDKTQLRIVGVGK